MKLIKLTQGKFAQVDDEDYDYLMQWKWYAWSDKSKTIWYAQRTEWTNKKFVRFKMHRVVLKLIDPKIIGDHIDNNGLNNQRNNLRIANHTENMRNRRKKNIVSSKYHGVCYYTQIIHKTLKNGTNVIYTCKPKWYSQIQSNGKTISLGRYTNEIEAAKAYDAKALELFGEFANLNFK